MASVPLHEARDPLFKGCTRPAMIWGVPLVPLVLATLPVLLISAWTTMLGVLAMAPIIIVMRMITKSDDQQFNLLGLKIYFRLVKYNANGNFWKASAYSPIAFTKRK